MKDTDQQLIESALAERTASEFLSIPAAPNKPDAQAARKHLVNTTAVIARALRARGDSDVDRRSIASLILSPNELEELMYELGAGTERDDLAGWLDFYRDPGTALNSERMQDDLTWVALHLESPPEGWPLETPESER